MIIICQRDNNHVGGIAIIAIMRLSSANSTVYALIINCTVIHGSLFVVYDLVTVYLCIDDEPTLLLLFIYDQPTTNKCIFLANFWINDEPKLNRKSSKLLQPNDLECKHFIAISFQPPTIKSAKCIVIAHEPQTKF